MDDHDDNEIKKRGSCELINEEACGKIVDQTRPLYSGLVQSSLVF